VGRQLFRELGLPSSGELFGVGCGVALTIALVLIAGGALGRALARILAKRRDAQDL